jgi:hypothetical protein
VSAEQITADLKFSIIPEWLLDSGCSDKALRLYAVLARYADNDNLTAYPGRGTLAKRMGCHRATVDRAVEELIGLGAVTKRVRVKDGKYQSSLYTIRRVAPSNTDAATPVAPMQPPPVAPMQPPPSHPCDIELEPKNVEPIRTRTATGTRKTAVPQSWQPNPNTIQQLKDKYPKIQVTEQVDTFLDYHRSKGSKFVDWDAAFRNWVRNADRYRQQNTGEKPGGWR